MKKQLMMVLCGLVVAATANAYLIQGVDLNVDYWSGIGSNECLLVVDWNTTGGDYNTQFHIFGFRWEGQKVVKDIFMSLQSAGVLSVTYAYGGGFIDDIIYDQTGVDGDYHTAGAFNGWWWAGQTTDGGQTWQDNGVGIDQKILVNGGIEGLNVDGYNWGSQNMSIPEPATLLMLAAGTAALIRKRNRA